MDVEIGEVNTTVRMVDSQALFNPQVKEAFIRELIARLLDMQKQQGSLDAGRGLRPAVSARRED